MEDFGQELAVTKNDIKHLEADMAEIKDGMKEGFEKIYSSMAEIHTKMDEKYVKKDEYKADKEEINKRFDKITTVSNLVLGSFVTILISLVVGFITGHFK